MSETKTQTEKNDISERMAQIVRIAHQKKEVGVVNKCETCKANKVCDHNNYGFENCCNYISADVVEVVRCKDCRHGSKCTDGYYTCRVDHRLAHDEDDFCSYGKERGKE